MTCAARRFPVRVGRWPWTVMNAGCDFEHVPMAQWHAAGLAPQALKPDR